MSHCGRLIKGYLIDGGFFCAGIVVCEEKVTDAAPIIRYMTGWSMQQVRGYILKRHWQITGEENAGQKDYSRGS